MEKVEVNQDPKEITQKEFLKDLNDFKEVNGTRFLRSDDRNVVECVWNDILKYI